MRRALYRDPGDCWGVSGEKAKGGGQQALHLLLQSRGRTFWLVAVRGAYLEALEVRRSCRGPRRRWNSALESASRSTDVAAWNQRCSV